MDTIILRKIPSGIVDLVKTGQATVHGGIIKDNATQKIIGHLEQVGNFGLNQILDLPGLNIINNVSNLVLMAQNRKIIEKLNNLRKTVGNIQALSWVNIGLSGVNFGVSVIGFILVNAKLSSIEKQLNNISKLTGSLLDNKRRELIQEAMNYINKSKLNIVEINSKGMTDILSQTVGNELIEIKSFLLKIIVQFADKHLISLDPDIVMAVYVAYINLAKVYIRAKRLNNENVLLLNDTLGIKEVPSSLTSKNVLDCLYQRYVFSNERLYSENEIDDIIDLYKLTCWEIFIGYDSQFQLLSLMAPNELVEISNRVNDAKVESKEKFILVMYDEKWRQE